MQDYVYSYVADSEDFTPSDPQIITFPSTAIVTDMMCVDYDVVGDDYREVDDTLTIDLAAENPVDVINGASQVSVTILDDGDGEFMKKYSEASPP